VIIPILELLLEWIAKVENTTLICSSKNKISCLFIEKAAILKGIAAFLFVLFNVIRLI
jgi:hypothetical protein